MSEWWTYSLSDFLMFSPRTYWRLVELYNRGVWPAQLVALLAGVGAMLLAANSKQHAERVLATVMAAAWLYCGWFFVLQRYGTINWAAPYAAAVFFAEAFLLVMVVLAKNSRPSTTAGKPWVQRTGWLMAAVGIVLYPAAGWFAGQPWAQAEVVGLMPDPTALATLGILLASPRFAGLPVLQRWLVRIIPVLVLLAGAATHWTMAS